MIYYIDGIHFDGAGTDLKNISKVHLLHSLLFTTDEVERNIRNNAEYFIETNSGILPVKVVKSASGKHFQTVGFESADIDPLIELPRF
ncbi:hypothetical protein LIX87_08625 [Weissella viridescens]|uniref:hypothetical protein n=1 Tax=Weissella viridescens TaxID=1629 RepID=UPI001D0918CA|nr:hypothetical protein [Weissella viridescens]MCB6841042.1 hypothetical protein [Weissella viridescens]MCB6847773.1 hypothetical protein [Weissella viridescens]